MSTAMKQINISQINLEQTNCCEICKNTENYHDKIKLFVGNEVDENTAVPCHHGQWWVMEDEFHGWGITPSSEDKGYCCR